MNKTILSLILLLRVENSKIIQLILHEASILFKVFAEEELKDKLKEYEGSGIWYNRSLEKETIIFHGRPMFQKQKRLGVEGDTNII